MIKNTLLGGHSFQWKTGKTLETARILMLRGLPEWHPRYGQPATARGVTVVSGAKNSHSASMHELLTTRQEGRWAWLEPLCRDLLAGKGLDDGYGNTTQCTVTDVAVALGVDAETAAEMFSYPIKGGTVFGAWDSPDFKWGPIPEWPSDGVWGPR